MTTDLVTLIANLALTLSFIVAVIFGLAQVKAAARDRRERLTLDTIRNFQTREFSELMQFVFWGKMPADSKEFRALSPQEQTSYIQFSQQMESLGILVAEKLVDIDLVDKILGNLVTTTWEKYKPMIESSRLNDPFLCEYFQWLAEQLDQRMKNSPRKPFHQSGEMVSQNKRS